MSMDQKMQEQIEGALHDQAQHMNNCKTQNSGISLIANERFEQMVKHGISFLYDVKNNNHYQLSQAASLLCYVDEEEVGGEVNEDGNSYDFGSVCPNDWDNRKEGLWNKMMNKSYKERLVIAGALIAAEIDRIDAL